MWTIASAAVVCTIMCDSCPASGSRTGPASLQEIRARAKSSRSGRGVTGAGERSRPKRRRRIGVPLERPQRRRDEEQRSDERRERVPRQPEHERRVANAERERLAGPHRHAPEDLLDPEPRLDPADEVVRPDRDAAGGDDHIRLERPRQSACSRARLRVLRRRRAARRQRLPPRARARA